MKNLILLITCTTLTTFAALKPLEVKELFPRLEIVGEIFVLDPAGKRIYHQLQERKAWRTIKENGKIENNWSSESDDYLVALHHTWEIQSDGTIKAHIEQYSKLENDPKNHSPKFKNLVRQEDLVVQDFGPITWLVSTNEKQRVVARFTPRLRGDRTPKALEKLPIVGDDIVVYDSQGNLWAQSAEFKGTYVGLITWKGAIQISYFPFEGATEIGFALDDKMELKSKDGMVLTLVSKTSFLPPRVPGKIYGRFVPDRKTPRLNSVRVVTSNKEEKFLKSFARN